MCASIDISIIVNERRLVHMKLYDLQYKLLFLDLKQLRCQICYVSSIDCTHISD